MKEQPEEDYDVISDRVRRMWYIDEKALDVKKLLEHPDDREFVSFDSNTYEAIDTKKYRLQLYPRFRDAAIALLEFKLKTKIDRFHEISKELMSINEETTELKNQINKLKNIGNED
jgi:hypothetical protein